MRSSENQRLGLSGLPERHGVSKPEPVSRTCSENREGVGERRQQFEAELSEQVGTDFHGSFCFYLLKFVSSVFIRVLLYPPKNKDL
jgi:hypothetical protein